MKWEPLTEANVVDRLRNACEHAIFDFKQDYDTSDPTTLYEVAKDLCAFANHLGGTILVGAVEDRRGAAGRISAFKPLTTSPGTLIRDVDRALRLCRPVPIADAIELPLDTNQVAAILGRSGPALSVVAINVPPMLNTPVGCQTCTGECGACRAAIAAGTPVTCDLKGKLVPDAWRFPIRKIEGTRYLRPEELAQVMFIEERRALIQLEDIRSEPSIHVWFNGGTDFQRNLSYDCKIGNVDPQMPACVLQLVGEPASTAEIPLRFIVAIWQSSEGWNIAINGTAFGGQENDRWKFRPPGNAPLAGYRPSGKIVGLP